MIRGAKKRTLPIEPYQKAAIKKSGICFSTEYKGCFEKLKFQCFEGHIFKSRADQIKNTSQWCPICAKNNRKKNKVV